MKQVTEDKLKLLTAMVIFGTIGLARRYIPYPSSVIALVRGVIGTGFLLLLLLYKKERFDRNAIKKNLVLLCFSGVFLGGNWILLFEAYRYTTVSTATICYYMAPVIIILVSPFIFHEFISGRKAVCAALAVFGMVLVSGIPESGTGGFKGILFGLGAACLYAGVVLLNKFITGISANCRTIFQLGISAAAVLPYVLLTEDLGSLEITAGTAAMLVLVGVLHTGISYALYFDSIKGIPASTVALFSYIDPVVAVLLSVFVLNEKMSLPSLAGVVLVLGAAIAGDRAEKS